MKFLFSIALLGTFVVATPLTGFTDLLFSSTETIEGILQQISNIIPNSTDLFTAPKEVLLGLTEQTIMQVLSLTCGLLIAANITRPLVTPDFDSMTLQLHTKCKESSFLLSNAEDILQSPDFDVSKKVVIYITGFMQTSEEDYVFETAKAFNCRGGYNFLTPPIAFEMVSEYDIGEHGGHMSFVVKSDCGS